MTEPSPPTDPTPAGSIPSDPAVGIPPVDPPVSAQDTGRSSFFVAAGILVSRLGGLLREVVLAAALGTLVPADAFRAALRIPQLLQNLLGEGALSAAFIPVYARLLDEGREDDANRVAGAVAGLIAATTAGLVLLGAVFARPLTSLLAPGFTGATYELTVTLVRIMTAGIGFVVLAAWCLGVLNAHRKFFLSYAAPLLWNAAQIAALGVAVWVGSSDEGIAEAVAWGVLVGGILQFLVQLPSVRRVAPGIRVSLRHDQPEVRQVLRRFGPAVAGRGVVQIGAYLDLLLASLLVSGSVAVLDFAQILYLLPISLFAISVAAAELPELSRTVTSGELLDRLRIATRRVEFFLVGATVFYVFGGAALVELVYERGAFTSSDTTLVWLTLAGYSLGLVPTGASRLLQNGLFARGDTAGPARIAVVRVAIAAGLGFVLMLQFEQFVLAPDASSDPGALVAGDVVDAPDEYSPSLAPLSAEERSDPDATAHLGVVGLALGSAVGAWTEYYLLRRHLRRKIGVSASLRAAVAPVVPAAAAAVVAMVATGLLTVEMPSALAAIAIMGAGGAAYMGVAFATGVTEVRSLLPGNRVKGREPGA